MDQNSVLIENMNRQSSNGDFEKSRETSVATTNGHPRFIEEVSDLIESVDQLNRQNFVLMKMARESGNEMGMGL